MRQASSAIARPSSSAPKRSRPSIVRAEARAVKKSTMMLPRWNWHHGMKSAIAAPAAAPDSSKSPTIVDADEVAADQAAAGHQRHHGEQHAGENGAQLGERFEESHGGSCWRWAWRRREVSGLWHGPVLRVSPSSPGASPRAVRHVLRQRQRLALSGSRATASPLSTASRAASRSGRRDRRRATIWQLSRLVGRRGAAVISSIASSSGDGAGRRADHARRRRRGRWRTSSCRRNRP